MPFAHSPVDGMHTVQFDATVHGRICTRGAQLLKLPGASARRFKGLVAAGEVVLNFFFRGGDSSVTIEVPDAHVVAIEYTAPFFGINPGAWESRRRPMCECTPAGEPTDGRRWSFARALEMASSITGLAEPPVCGAPLGLTR
jgi:hypothetical protein